MKKEHKFDKKTFDPDQVEKDMPNYSPKIVSLLKKIKELDKEDIAVHGEQFKHLIFSEVKQGGYGVKIIAAAMLASGFKLGYDSHLRLFSDAELLKNKSENFLMLSSTAIFKSAITVQKKKAILGKYNQRPENVHGELVRFILLDAGFKEGIDLFDVKYVHIFEPQVSKADQKQAIGRATRLCGQKGLEFHPKFGWPLEVFIYDVDVPDEMVPSIGRESLFDAYLMHNNIDVRKVEFANQLERYSMVGAVDYELTKPVHRFQVEDEDIDTTWLFEGGALKKRPEDVSCDGKCSSRPTKDVPLSLPLFTAVALANKVEIPKYAKTTGLRSFMCEKLKEDADFCKQAKLAWKDPNAYIEKHKENIVEEWAKGRSLNIPSRSRPQIRKFLAPILPQLKLAKTVKTAKTAPKTLKPVRPSSIKKTKSRTPGTLRPLDKPMDFQDLRKYIQENYSQYAWPKVKMDNLCETKGGASTIVNFTPTQDFVRHYFTPQNPYKGMLLWHSVGTGKTCSAIATATSSFEKEGYTILWVTRTTLKSDIFKNMFDQVCHLALQDQLQKGKPIPNDFAARVRLLSDSWRMRPMSYKQFSNLVSGKNKFYEDLVKINGKEDPLRKTLLIIDEAHKLYGGNDLSSIERPDMKKLHKSIMNSYKTSGKDSVRLMLMTATPITNDPMELIKLLNLLRSPSEQFEEDYEKFATDFMVDDNGQFTKRGSRKFLDAIAGCISYLSRERDARQFAQPIVQAVHVPMSKSRFDEEAIERWREDHSRYVEDLQAAYERGENHFKSLKTETMSEKKSLKERCKGLKKEARQECLTTVESRIDRLNDELFEKKERLTDDKVRLRERVRASKKELSTKIKEAQDDRSQQGIIENKCFKKDKRPKSPKSGSA